MVCTSIHMVVDAPSNVQLGSEEANFNLFGNFCYSPLEPLAQLKTDSIRGKVDAAISQALKVPDPVFVRELLEREPGLSVRDIAPRNLIDDEEDEDHSDEDVAPPSLFAEENDKE